MRNGMPIMFDFLEFVGTGESKCISLNIVCHYVNQTMSWEIFGTFEADRPGNQWRCACFSQERLNWRLRRFLRDELFFGWDLKGGEVRRSLERTFLLWGLCYIDFLGRGEVEQYIKNNKNTDVLEMMRNLMDDFWRVFEWANVCNMHQHARCVRLEQLKYFRIIWTSLI